MALAKYISDTPNIDKWFFKFLECFLSDFGESLPFQLSGIEMADIISFVEKMNEAYEDNFKFGYTQDSSHWIDLAAAILKEFELLELDDISYDLFQT